MADKEKNKNWLILLVLVLGTIALYSPVIKYDYVNFDDPRYVVNNFHITRGFTWSGLAWCFQAGYAANWHPLTWMSHMFDCQIFGLEPAGHHAVNVVLHAANSALLFLILFRLTAARWRSAFVAALFAWHPMHVESVAWISERKDVLSTLFWMLTTLAYLHYVKHRGWHRYLLVLFFFTLGLMAKQMLVTLPFVLLLLDWWPLRRFQTRDSSPPEKFWRIMVEKIPFFPLIIASSILTVIAQKRGGALSSLDKIPWMGRFFTADISYYRYLGKLLWPHNMAIIYPYEFRFSYWETAAASIVLIAVSIAALVAHKNRPYLLVGWLWFLGTLVPVIGLVQVGAQSMADRYTYIPSIGLFIMIIWGVSDWIGRRPLFTDLAGDQKHFDLRRRIVAGLGIFLAGITALGASRQLGHWYNGGTLFSHSIAVTEDNFISHSSYAHFLRDHEFLEKARQEAELAVRIAPEYGIGHNFLGEILMKQNKLDEAVKHLELAKKYRPEGADSYRDLGALYQQKNQPEKALAEFNEARKIDPDDPTLYFLIANTLFAQGKTDEAKTALDESLRLAPNYAEAHNQLAALLSSQQKTAEAIEHYRAALKIVPDYPEALNNLAWILAANADSKFRSGSEALRLALLACELTHYTQPMVIGTLADAYAEAGKFTEAEAMAKKARDLALANGDKEVAAKNEELMSLYRSHQAYHEKASP